MDTFSLLVDTATKVMRYQTGIVIPVYLPEGVDRQCGEALLRDTAIAYRAQVADPATICLSVDGEHCGADVAYQIASDLGTLCHVSKINRGKLEGAANGVRTLLQRMDLAYVAVVDQDGDHFANELLNFVRVALHVAQNTGDEHVLVLGRRASRHRPMGLLRGELEELADRVLLDALYYRAAMTGRPLRLEYALSLDEFPDFHSGYKLFDRETAEKVFLGEPRLAGVPDDCYYRHACEAVMTVEALEHSAYLGVVNRTTLNGQPISTFGRFNLGQLVADKMIWPCKRLGVPLPFVEQWLANHMQRLLLHTLAPAGVEELERIRRLVVDAYDPDRELPSVLQPLFL
jgi:hypothetical protein